MLPAGLPETVAGSLADSLFHEPARVLAAVRPGTTYSYEFAWPSPVPGAGAARGLELGFVFDNLGHSGLEGPAAPRELATRLHRAWVDFVRDGDPGWPLADRPVFNARPESTRTGG
jgi:para-nitrobenzyl esterase